MDTSTLKHSFTGNYGIAFLPDEMTIAKCYELAHTILPTKAEYILGRDSLPHGTLYHAQLKDVPLNWVRNILVSLNIKLKGRSLVCDQIAAFRDYYVFWYINKAQAHRNILQLAHEESLSLSRFLMSGNSSKRNLIRLNAQELHNSKKYGYPWVRALFSPHITLGFNRGTQAKISHGLRKRWMMEVSSVEFVRIGYPGKMVIRENRNQRHKLSANGYSQIEPF